MLKKMDTWFDNQLESLSLLKFFIACGIIISIVYILVVCDYRFATTEDYTSLLNKQDLILKDFNSVYKCDNSEISILDKEIVITLSNKQCKIKMFFDRNSIKYIRSEFIDLSIPTMKLIFLLIVFSCFGGIFGTICYWTFSFILAVLFSTIEILIKNSDNKKAP